ncbi:MAG: hypothetical protein MUC50_14035 [Myxococcota bacterium]|nr:hypothetical protein [Myxococcota bacterium]
MGSLNKILQWLALATCALLLGCPPDSLLTNKDFDLWCGDVLCGWQVDRGKIEKAPTWHKKDLGVGLVGSDVAISQEMITDQFDVDCISMELVAYAGTDVDLYLEIDFLDDNYDNPEYSQQIPKLNWTPIRFDIRPPEWFSTARFIVRKVGDGKAVLARVAAVNGIDCTGKPVALDQAPNGVPCESDHDCASGICASIADPALDGEERGYCSECRSDIDCPNEELCGVGADSKFLLLRQCVAPASRVLGERCAGGSECELGICTEGVCSTCGPHDPCALGESCDKDGQSVFETEDHRWLREAGRTPFRCAGRVALTGEPCLHNSDCESGSCEAEAQLNLCYWDGRSCETTADCGIQGGNCLELGARGGVCL